MQKTLHPTGKRIWAHNFNLDHIFESSITWSDITSGFLSSRFNEQGFLFDGSGTSAFFKKREEQLAILGLINTQFSKNYSEVLNPTLHFQTGDFRNMPLNRNLINEEFINLVNKAIIIAKLDWDSRELSWNFKQNELIKQNKSKILLALEDFINYWSEKFYELHFNEEALNLQFIEIYGLTEELTPQVPFQEITVLQEESKIVNGKLFIDPIPVLLQLLSYSTGCIFGRYGLDKPRLILANQGETLQDFLTQVPNPSFIPDEDNIIPVLDAEWFNDDIVGRFKVFLKAAFGNEHFEENLQYIEDTIGKDIRKYFVKDFYNDHIKRYKKRPIYWMFSSPKGHFKALIYMHRYQPDLCCKLLNDYLQAFISKLEAARQTQTMLSLREDISAREKTVAIKEIDKQELMLKDCREYEKTLFNIAT